MIYVIDAGVPDERIGPFAHEVAAKMWIDSMKEKHPENAGELMIDLRSDTTPEGWEARAIEES